MNAIRCVICGASFPFSSLSLDSFWSFYASLFLPPIDRKSMGLSVGWGLDLSRVGRNGGGGERQEGEKLSVMNEEIAPLLKVLRGKGRERKHRRG
jgi:hypothetical protein